MIDELASKALQQESPDLLRGGLNRLLVDRESEWLEDSGALVMAMAPLHDCATRIGLNPQTFFAEAAKEGPVSLAAVVREFGTRKVDPAAFNFVVDDLPGGARYRIETPVEDPTADARLTALDLALQVTPRKEAERILMEQYDPEIAAVVLDEVFGRDGRRP